MSRWIPIAACFALLLAPMWAQADPFADPLILSIEQRHEAGVAGNKAAVAQLVPDLEQLVAAHPENVLLSAYLGSAYTLLSRDLFPGPAKLKYLKLGLKTMDDAVAAAPNDPAVRFVRAVNNFSLPFFVHRAESARVDFEILVTALRHSGAALGLNTETAQAIYYYAGLSYREENDRAEAREAWQAGIGLGAETALGKKISRELDRIKS